MIQETDLIQSSLSSKKLSFHPRHHFLPSVHCFTEIFLELGQQFHSLRHEFCSWNTFLALDSSLTLEPFFLFLSFSYSQQQQMFSASRSSWVNVITDHIRFRPCLHHTDSRQISTESETVLILLLLMLSSSLSAHILSSHVYDFSCHHLANLIDLSFNRCSLYVFVCDSSTFSPSHHHHLLLLASVRRYLVFVPKVGGVGGADSRLCVQLHIVFEGLLFDFSIHLPPASKFLNDGGSFSSLSSAPLESVVCGWCVCAFWQAEGRHTHFSHFKVSLSLSSLQSLEKKSSDRRREKHKLLNPSIDWHMMEYGSGSLLSLTFGLKKEPPFFSFKCHIVCVSLLLNRTFCKHLSWNSCLESSK